MLSKASSLSLSLSVSLSLSPLFCAFSLSFSFRPYLAICLSVCLAISTCRTSICGTHMPTEIFHGILTGWGRGNGKGNLQQRQVNFQLRAQRANRSQRAKQTSLPKTGGQSQSKAVQCKTEA